MPRLLKQNFCKIHLTARSLRPIIVKFEVGPLVKRLRHGPFTAETRVRFPYGSLDWLNRLCVCIGGFLFVYESANFINIIPGAGA